MRNYEGKNLRVFSREGLKKLVRPFLVLFLLSSLIINWNSVSCVFNYKVISNAVSRFLVFLDNKQVLASEVNTTSDFNKENSLEIPKIGVIAPLIVTENSSQKDLDEKLDKGVVIFPNSALPNEVGQTIILGHSAPPSWPKINYDGIFSRISELGEKDEIILYFNHQKYTYSVNQKVILEKGEEISNDSETSGNTLLLISCWPPGKNIKRIIIESTLIKT